jgi:WD40 repeat protein
MNKPGKYETNPFVGPCPIKKGQPLFGRDTELRELYNLLRARRIVVLHSPSGAGKSSLVQAGLVPRLEKEGFDVWKPIRVNLDPSGLNGLPDGTNRYLLSAMMSLEEGLEPAQRRSAATLAGLDFLAYLQSRPRTEGREGRPVALLFDQFEEVLTVAPNEVKQKSAFFTEVGKALDSARDRENYWALFVIREDYLAALAPYRDYLPMQMSTTFRLDLLGREAAEEAAIRLANEGNRTFPAAEMLVKNLAMIAVPQPVGPPRQEAGLHVEPVMLQVVCHRMWKDMRPDDPSIDDDDVEKYGDVTKVLGDYYKDAVRKVAGSAGARRSLREWVGTKLIVGGIRAQVRHEKDSSAGPREAQIAKLLASYLVRTEDRAGVKWLELSHDRLVEPVLKVNEELRKVDEKRQEKQRKADEKREIARRPPFYEQATAWRKEGKKSLAALLLSAEALLAAEVWAKGHNELLQDGDQEFLDQSRELRDKERAERDKERAEKKRIIAVAVIAVMAALVMGAVVQWARDQRAEAIAARERAITATKLAVAAKEETHGLLVAALEEHARSAYLAGSAAQAIMYAERAYEEGSRSTMTLTTLSLAASVTIDAQLARVTGHNDKVYSVAFWPATDHPADRSLMATASADQTARLWDVKDPRNPVYLSSLDGPNGHHDKVRAASFRADGKCVVTAGDDGTARLWDVTDLAHPSFLGVLTGHEGVVRSAVFNAAGDRVVTAGDDGTARLWDVTDPTHPRPPVVLGGHQKPVMSASFSPDGKQVVTAGDDRIARVWDVASGRLVRQLGRHREGLFFAAFSPGGALIVTASADNTARLWDAANGELLFTLEGHDDQLASAAFSGDQRVVTASYDGTARVWSTSTGELLMTLAAHDGPVLSTAFMADDAVVATAGADATVRLWKADGPLVAWVPFNTYRDKEMLKVRSAELSPDGAYVVTAAAARGGTTAPGTRPLELLLDVRNPRNPKQVGHFPDRGKGVSSATFSPDGKRVVTACNDGDAELWDVTAPSKPRLLSAWPCQQGELFRAELRRPDGQVVVTAGKDGTTRLWSVADPATPALLATLEGHVKDKAVKSASFSHDGKLLVTAGDDESAILWDVSDPKTPRSIHRWTGIKREASFAAFSPDDKRIAVAGQDTVLRLWSVAQPDAPPMALAGHGRALFDVQWSPDGSRLVTAEQDGWVGLWEAESGRLIAVLRGHSDNVLSAVFSPDGNEVVSAGADGTMRIWDVHLETRSPAQLAELIRCGVPLKWVGEALQPSVLPDCQKPAAK